MIRYFRELLQALKSIDQRLGNLEKCIHPPDHRVPERMDRYSISVKQTRNNNSGGEY